MSQEDTRIDLSEMKDTDPIISYEQTEEAELVELNSTWDNIVNTFKHNRLAMIGLVVIGLIILAAVFRICRTSSQNRLPNTCWEPTLLAVTC